MQEDELSARPANRVDIYTDGACSGNPGPGGWGALLRYGAHTREMHGGEGRPRPTTGWS